MPRQGDDGRTLGESREEPRHASEDLTNLARAALAGSSADLDRFISACWQYAYDAATWLKRQHQGAEDSAQDAAMAVLRLLRADPPELDPETVGAFVRVVVLRSARAAAQRRLREADAVTNVVNVRELADPAVAVETAEWAHALRAVVDALPPPLGRLIGLRHGEDLSTREIARQLRVSHMTVARLLREAEDMLRRRLRGLDGPGGRATPTDESRP
jgi:RNA polymerase sigma factor (sigma-70 family)